MSKYDNIQTATELVVEVKINGLSTAMEDIARAQDIFGNAPVEELTQLANDRRYEGWSTQGTSYGIITSIWNWVDVMRFWNTHTNPQTKELEKLREAREAIADGNRKLWSENDMLDMRLTKVMSEQADLYVKAVDAQRRAEGAEAEVIRLKAKLYDLLVERGEYGLKDKSAAKQRPTTLLCEAVFDISCIAQHLAEQCEIAVEDSRALFASVFCWAEEFEAAHPDSWDSPECKADYIAEIDEFAEKKLRSTYSAARRQP